jgi:hypothetical protein
MRRQYMAAVCNAQIFLTLSLNTGVIHKSFMSSIPMRHQPVVPTSSLPSLMMPCPVCAGRMVYHGHRHVSADLEDTVYACRRCGAELIRTSTRRQTEADKAKTAHAA